NCSVSGMLSQDPTMVFEVLDAVPNAASKAAVDSKSGQASALLGAAINKSKGFSGIASWQPEISEPGIYTLRAALMGHNGAILERRATVVVIEPGNHVTGGEFGWTLPQGEGAFTLPALAALLGEMGVSWVKFPAWAPPD